MKLSGSFIHLLEVLICSNLFVGNDNLWLGTQKQPLAGGGPSIMVHSVEECITCDLTFPR